MKKIVISCMFLSVGLTIYAQPQDSVEMLPESHSEYVPVLQYWEEHNVFQHLDASVTLGTTGIGVDFSSPIGKYCQLRAGFDFMPHFHYKANFTVLVGDDPQMSASKFQRMSELLTEYTNLKVEDNVDVIGVPTYYNFKFLFDVFPFKKNKHWYLTAGFYWGNSQIGKGYNTTEDMLPLLAVTVYNKMYERAIAWEPLFTVGDFSLDDPHVQEMLEEKFRRYGRMGLHVGNYTHDIMDAEGNVIHAKGDPYMMEPGEDGMARIKVSVNSFKPYIGFGYTGRLFKGNDKYKVSFDCGALFWGGTPSIVTHDGTDLAKDVSGIGGKIGDYAKTIKSVKAFPVLNVRFTKTIF